MTDEPVSDEIRYEQRVDDALRGMVRRLICEVAESGLPGSHHFYLTFRTGDAGVAISPALSEQHPEEMTIVLQHQFRDLEVSPEAFSVTLRFAGVQERLVVPWSALTVFADPHVEFGLRLGPPDSGEAADDEREDPPAKGDEEEAVEPTETESRSDDRGQGRVVRLDDFRRD